MMHVCFAFSVIFAYASLVYLYFTLPHIVMY